MYRKPEYFGESTYGEGSESVMSTVRTMCRQERDWTCSIASLRTLLSGIESIKLPDEDYLIETFNLEKGPYNSKDILNKGLLNGYIYKVGCNEPAPVNNQLIFLTSLMTDYNVMIECLINYAHWIVLLGYVKLGNIEQDRFIYYDPYYHRINTIVADELITMWHDIGERPLHRDYIAISKSERSD